MLQLILLVPAADYNEKSTPLIVRHINLLVPELFFLILAHPVYKM